MLSKKDKDLFAAQWRWRQYKAEPDRYIGRRGFLRENWGLVVVGAIVALAVGACIYGQ